MRERPDERSMRVSHPPVYDGFNQVKRPRSSRIPPGEAVNITLLLKMYCYCCCCYVEICIHLNIFVFVDITHTHRMFAVR